MFTLRLVRKEDIYTIIPLLRLLNNTTDDTPLKQRLDEMTATGYECLGVYDDDRLIGICGLWLLIKHYVGRHIEPDNVIIHPDYRSKGVGELMMKWVDDYAKSKGCVASELNCYVSNERGIQFWKDQGFTILGYHMQKKY